MSVELETTGGGIHAIAYRDGQRVGDFALGGRCELEPASDQLVRADAPKIIPKVAGDGRFFRSFTGWYSLHGSLIAIFGAMTPEEAIRS